MTYLIRLIALLCCSAYLSGCGGSGSSSTPTTQVSGVVMAGPASGAAVTVKTTAGTVVAGPVTTDGSGAYTIAIPTSALAAALVFEARGGSFPDEATAATGVALDALTAHVAAGALTSGATVSIDPSSTIVQKLVAGGSSTTAADAAFTTAFGYTPDCSVKPVFAALSSASTDAQRLAGLRAAAFSQLTKDLGLAPDKQFELIQALADDLSDGVLDGRKTGGIAVTTASGTAIPADIANRFAAALMTFQASSLNRSRLTMDKLGAPPFATVALTGSYKVEYLPGTTAAAQGKTSFKVRLTNPADNTPATGKSVTLTPKMYMATMSHGSPVDTCVESATPGTYDCTVYYLMASGPGMGIWELKVKIGTETATYYPPVAMAMGTTSRATLKGVADTIGAMMGMGTSPRTYYLFNDGSTFGMTSTFKLFVAAADDATMMKFPAVSSGTTLHDALNTAWTVNGGASGVQVSSDNGATWVSATDNGGGHWSAAGLTGLASGGTVRVRLTVNGEQKTTTGSATLSATNMDYTLFTIVGGM